MSKRMSLKDTLNQLDKVSVNICVNAQCKLRKHSCKGFEGCPGFKGKDDDAGHSKLNLVKS